MKYRNTLLYLGLTICCLIAVLIIPAALPASQTPVNARDMDKELLAKLERIPQRLQTAVDETAARLVGRAWLNVCPDFVGQDFSVKNAQPIYDKDQSRTLAYVVHLQPQGFIIIAADAEIRPIVAFSEQNDFSLDELPENIALSMLRVGLSLKLVALDEHAVEPAEITGARRLWQDFLAQVNANGNFIRSYAAADAWDVEIGPFLTSIWSQSTAGGDAVWNYYTPPFAAGSTGNYPCGCVATAMAQILNYYHWPITGTGSHSYIWNSQTLSADFGTTGYDWANTLDNYYTTTTVAQRQAAGLLSYHCGVAIDMEYGLGGSGAFTEKVPHALIDNFRTSGRWKANDGTPFYDELYATILNQRPGELAIIATAVVPPAGHAIVVDGVHHYTGATKYYHLNFGWGGSSNGWYDIANPFSAGGANWDVVTGAVVDVIPTPELADPGTTTGSSSFNIEWQGAALQDADKYELQQLTFSPTLENFFDGAEGGTGNWEINGHWEATTSIKYAGSYSFRGYLGDYLYSTLQLAKGLKIDATTTITYRWGVYGHINTKEYLQISVDGKNWETLKTYDQQNNGEAFVWNQENSIDLSAYIDKAVDLRVVLDFQGGYYYSGITYNFVGFFLDNIAINNCNMDEWVIVNNNILSESYTVNVVEQGDYLYRLRAFADGAWRDWTGFVDITIESITCDDIFTTSEIPAGEHSQVAGSSGTVEAFITCDDQAPSNTGSLTTIDRWWDIYCSDAAKIRLYYTSQADGNPKPSGFSANPVISHFTGDEWQQVSSNAPMQVSGDYYYVESTNAVSGFSPFTLGNYNPIAVRLASFAVETRDNKNFIHWRTESEIDVAGYYIQRSSSCSGEWQRLSTEMILTKGGNARGASYETVDALVSPELPWYRLETLNLNGSREFCEPFNYITSGVAERALPKEFALYAGYPNPFNPQTTIRYDLPQAAQVNLTIYDARGRKVRTLINNSQNAGAHTIVWNSQNDLGLTVANGLYFYRISAGEFTDIRKITLLK